jgi:hypothetical protein
MDNTIKEIHKKLINDVIERRKKMNLKFNAMILSFIDEDEQTQEDQDSDKNDAYKTNDFMECVRKDIEEMTRRDVKREIDYAKKILSGENMNDVGDIPDSYFTISEMLAMDSNLLEYHIEFLEKKLNKE